MRTLALYALTFCLGLIFAVLKLQYGVVHPTIAGLFIIAIAVPGVVAVAHTLEYVLIDMILDRHGAGEASDLARLVVRLLVYSCSALLLLRFGFQQDITGLLATSAVLSVVLGLALQPTLGNLLSGIALEIEHPVRIGDYLEVDGALGRVRSRNWRSVVLESPDATVIVVPNSDLTNRRIIVRSATAPSRFHIFFTAPSTVPPARVIEIGDQVMRQPIRDLSQEKHGSIVINGVEAFSGALKYDLRYYTTNVLGFSKVGSDVLGRLWYALSRADIPMTLLPAAVAPSAGEGIAEADPVEPDAAKMVRRVQQFADAGAANAANAAADGADRPGHGEIERQAQLLQHVPLFSGLAQQHLRKLVVCARRLHFTRQEPVQLAVGGIAQLRLIIIGGVRIFGPVDESSWSASTRVANAAPARACAILSEDELAQISASLARYVGPVSEILTRDAAAQARDRRALFQRLAEHIETETERDRFLAQAPTQDSTDLGPGTAFGAWGIACGEPLPAVVGDALEETELLVVSAANLSALLRTHEHLVDTLATSLARTRTDISSSIVAERITRFHQASLSAID